MHSPTVQQPGFWGAVEVVSFEDASSPIFILLSTQSMPLTGVGLILKSMQICHLILRGAGACTAWPPNSSFLFCILKLSSILLLDRKETNHQQHPPHRA